MTHAWIPDPDEREALNAALLATGHDSGFWDEHGQPAPWPNDINEWRPATSNHVTTDPGGQPF